MSRVESKISGWKVATNSGIALHSFDTIYGELIKVQVHSGNWENGSLFIMSSGTVNKEVYLSKTNMSGTNDYIVYPRLRTNNISGTALSGTSLSSYERPFMAEHILLGTSGAGDGTSGTSTIYYKTP